MPDKTIDIKRVINIEDTAIKHAQIKRVLEGEGIRDIVWAKNAEDGIEAIVEAQKDGDPFDLLILDMEFDFFGELLEDAGERTKDELRTKGIGIPIIICSSLNYRVPGTVGTAHYMEGDDSWKTDLKKLLKEA